MFIQKRLYYLKKPNYYQKIFHHHFFIKEKIENTSKIISFFTVQKLISQYSNPPQFIDTQLKKLFWQNATLEIKQALIFSYDSYIQHHSQKVHNIEISNWINIPFFNQYLKNTFFRLKHNHYNIFKFLTTKTGKHKLGIRFENIHLVLDHIHKKPIFSIHWDSNPPTLSLKLIKHYLFDDILS